MISYKLDLRVGVMFVLAVYRVIGVRLEFEPSNFKWRVILIF